MIVACELADLRIVSKLEHNIVKFKAELNLL